MVLIHGRSLNGDMWEKQATFLAEHGLRAVNYDRRGYGEAGLARRNAGGGRGSEAELGFLRLVSFSA